MLIKMKSILIFFLFCLSFFSLSSQVVTVPRFGTDSTLDIMTWNIEYFPTNGQTTAYYVADIIRALDVDIIAFQEVEDTVLFKQMMSNLPQYECSFYSEYYAGLAYIYKADIIEVNSIYEIYTSSQYWSPFPRSPLVLDFNYDNQQFILMNNHFKCCGNGVIDYSDTGDEETRRYYASNLLRTFIDNYMSTKNVIILGDLNDEITDPLINNVFKSFINYPNLYMFADMEIAQSTNTNWSYPSYPSHLDHMLITNELFDDFQNPDSKIETQKIDDYLTNGWNEYEQNISDHRPVAIKLKINQNSNSELFSYENSDFYIFPNPVESSVSFNFNPSPNNSRIEIYNFAGQLIEQLYLSGGQIKETWNRDSFASGLYFVKLVSQDNKSVSSKMILL